MSAIDRKRVKFWVVESITGGFMLFSSKAVAKSCAGSQKARPMVERLPGDVVLSREDVAEIRKRLTGIVERGELSDGAAAIDIAVVATRLLRGRR